LISALLNSDSVDGIDAYFYNIGGERLEAALAIRTRLVGLHAAI
jgi:hypothetical protein